MKKKIAAPNWILSIVLLFIFLCFYVLLSCKVIAIGYKMEEAKKLHQDIHMLNRHYKAEVLRLTSQSELLRRADAFNLKLENPSIWCYVDIETETAGARKDGRAEAGTY